MNKRTRTLSIEEYKMIIKTIRIGFNYNGVKFKPNMRVATILVMQANLGMRIGDILNLIFITGISEVI